MLFVFFQMCAAGVPALGGLWLWEAPRSTIAKFMEKGSY